MRTLKQGGTVVEVTLEPHTCWNCGVVYGISEEIVDRRRGDGQSFYCTNGHSAVYKETKVQVAERRAQEAEDALAAVRARNDQLLTDLGERETELRRAKKRASAGVCPVCKRSFQAVARHVERQHPGHAQGCGVKARQRKAIDAEARKANR